MKTFDDFEVRLELGQLSQLAVDAWIEGQYATAEHLLEQAEATVQPLNDMAMLIAVRGLLAENRRLQGKEMQALPTYAWLIGLTKDPVYNYLMEKEEILSLLSLAFTAFVQCGIFLPEMTMKELLRVVDDGLRWLESIGKTSWAADLHRQKSDLLERQGDLEGAFQEIETALALAFREPNHLPNLPKALETSVVECQLEMANLLCKMGAYNEAIELLEEVLATPDPMMQTYHSAYYSLAETYFELGETVAAQNVAQQSLIVAEGMESAEAMAASYHVLLKIYLRAGQIEDATIAAANLWQWARRDGSIEICCIAFTNCAAVRLQQALIACALSPKSTLPKRLPRKANRKLAKRRLRSARHFIDCARPLATKMDNSGRKIRHQDNLDKDSQMINQLAALLS